jgi:hypothetical protein
MNIPGRMGGTQQVPIEALNNIYRELKVFFSQWESKFTNITTTNSIAPVDKGSGSVTSNTLRVTLDNILSSEINNIKNYLEFQNWDNITGNSLEFVYYTGVEPGNPSGSTNNVKHIIYKKGTVTELTKTLAYNSNDKVISIVAI